MHELLFVTLCFLAATGLAAAPFLAAIRLWRLEPAPASSSHEADSEAMHEVRSRW